jgi:hypothetical protein
MARVALKVLLNFIFHLQFLATIVLKTFAMFNPFNDTTQTHLLTSSAHPSPLLPFKEVIYIYLQMTSIQNKVFVYSIVDKFTIFFQNKLGT